MKRFLIQAAVGETAGTQTWYVDATSPKEAMRAYKSGAGEIYENEVEVISLEEPEIIGETTLDDFGDIPLTESSYLLLDLARKCLRVLREDEYPELRQQLREAIAKASPGEAAELLGDQSDPPEPEGPSDRPR